MNKKMLLQSSIVFSLGIASGFIVSKILEKSVGELRIIYGIEKDKPNDMLLVLDNDKSLTYDATKKYVKLRVTKNILTNEHIGNA